MKFSYRKSNVKGRSKEEKRLKQHDIRAQREVVRKASIRMRMVRCDGKEETGKIQQTNADLRSEEKEAKGRCSK